MGGIHRLARHIRTNLWVHCAFLVSVIGVGILLGSLPGEIAQVCLAVGVLGLVYHTILTIAEQTEKTPPWPLTWLPERSLFVVPVGAVIGMYALATALTPVRLVVFGALLVVFFYFWFILPAAWYHKLRYGNRYETRPEPDSSLSILVPAYNEIDCIGRCLDSLTAAHYPGDKEIIVIDDGSTDGTYEEALAYATEAVEIIQKPNGGKHAALNDGLSRATGDVIVTVDADSVITDDALVHIVADLEEDTAVGAVGGTVKLLETPSLVEKLQALEYAIGINTFRRAFAMLGSVNVVPGCLGCFRRTALEEVGGYDGDTLTEDFDVTIKLLKAGWDVRASEALSYTEPPGTWRDLYHQRLRWNRGNIETLYKHADILHTTSWSNFSGIVFPYQVISLMVLPVATAIILGTIAAELLLGHVAYVVTILTLFALLQILAGLFALVLDENDLRLLLYAPVAVIWYKYYMTSIMLKSLIDVLRQTDKQWTQVSRQSTTATQDPPHSDPADQQAQSSKEVSDD